MHPVTIAAPAKVNLVLRVVCRRSDGFHDLEMVMVPLSLADEIVLTPLPAGIEFHLDGEGDQGMAGEKNLAWRAARLMQEAVGRSDGVRILLKKRIPVAAGLGGGSSDAAAVLKGVSQLWGLGWGPERLAHMGKRLGADVPFFCFGRPAYVEGIGDVVNPYEEFPSLPLLLINPGFSVPTPWVYQQWDLQPVPSEIEGLTQYGRGARFRPLFKAFCDVISSLHNDLERVTIPAHPEISEIKRFLLDSGAAGALMSGSGPTVFGVFEDASVREEALVRASGRAHWEVFAAESRSLS